MSTLARAILMATEAHGQQTRRDGHTPYIVHPLRVMLVALEFGLDHAIVGVLHDTIEDTDLTILDLRDSGFSEEIVHAVWLLTRVDEVLYGDYLAALKIDRLARIVKIIDIEDNLFDQPSEKQRSKYTTALSYLKS